MDDSHRGYELSRNLLHFQLSGYLGNCMITYDFDFTIIQVDNVRLLNTYSWSLVDAF